ncbi:MAG TPA: histidine kinase [Flavitalea sp.]|nr:histidine kinase [Flavitalea sp.]
MNPSTSMTNHDFKLTKLPALNDIGFRLILIPFLGIAIPMATKLVDHASFSHWQIKASYLYTILLAFLIWQGNRYLLFTLRSYFNWFNRPLKKIFALLLAISFYSIPLSMLALIGWYRIFMNGEVDWNKVYLSVSIIMICVLFVTHVYETVFLVKESENEMLRNEQLERAKAEAQLEALKHQVDPHFIFNSLNTLSYLIETDPQKASRFNDTLADIYHYILQNKMRDLVLLKEEVAFVSNYFLLLQIRFGTAIDLQIDISPDILETYVLPPISLQTLVENAIKHNAFSEDHPMMIKIYLENSQVIVSNNLNRVHRHRKNSGIGLQNLSDRYELITHQRVKVDEEKNRFIVTLPVLTI